MHVLGLKLPLFSTSCRRRPEDRLRQETPLIRIRSVSVVSQIYLPIFLSETTLKSHGKGFIRKSVWKFVLEENFCQFGALEELKLKI